LAAYRASAFLSAALMRSTIMCDSLLSGVAVR
jgi:hypothetical protein